MRGLLFCLVVVFSSFVSPPKESQILVFTKTAGFRHESIEVGVETLKALGIENQFAITHTENAEVFNYRNLKRYDAVIFLNTTGDVLNAEQEQAFEKYINKGGSFMGIHAATDTEFEWPWFNKLVGAYFLDHPKQQTATINRVIRSHPATKHLPNQWQRYDEWYNFKSMNKQVNVLLMLDETSYEGGKNGAFHPIAWCHEFDGGRAFYTGLGHTVASYSEPEFKKHLLGGILYCLNR
ncbi:ThuA domain-containing protein [Aestuariibaculum suncheonense]|uniref:ThuA domain-containing protein n=1 Tax=Aestuariibaculum suncheonense TaxID=1028745 RepID=A0A8J6UI72_9FLAO|nr:ThuA domain-containing protein [Aestuariibaculum suncheonense]MBD0833881.1 ThuA domain-containing protein [Aestuariibaculum suncheonense]